VFILESKLGWLSGLRVARLLSNVPHDRRVVLDADGLYNEVVTVDGYDRNHACQAESHRWKEACERLGSRIFQPTMQPLSPRVKPLLFYGFPPDLEGPVRNKPVDIAHVCHNWWRWKQLEETFFPALAKVRGRIGEIRFVGLWWDGVPPWASALGLSEAFRVDPPLLQRLGIEVRPPVPFTEVVRTMSAAKVNVMTQRPLFQKLGIVTSKYFELFAADTIPLVLTDLVLAESIYGPSGAGLILDGKIEERLVGALSSPEPYRQRVQAVRDHLRAHHSYQNRVRQLVAALEA
jgi:hypothetical protein